MSISVGLPVETVAMLATLLSVMDVAPCAYPAVQV
jgi:hypothetical protein